MSRPRRTGRRSAQAEGARGDGAGGGRSWTIALASVVAAVLTWLLQALTGRVMGPEAYAAFMVVWGLVFIEVGTLLGLQQEVTRATASGLHKPSASDIPPDARPILTGSTIGIIGAVLCVATAPLWGDRVFGPGSFPVTLITAAGLVGYAIYNAVAGALAGAELWTDYSMTIVTDAALRLALVLPVTIAGLGLTAQAAALNGAALAWLLLWYRPRVRAAARSRVVGRQRQLTSRALHTMVGTGCSAIMISGFPVLLQVTSSEPLGASAGAVLAAVVATRAPLLLPLNAFQAVIITRFMRTGRVAKEVAALLGGVSAVAVLGAVAAYVVGPQLLVILYGAQFRIAPGVIAALVLAAGVMAMQTVVGSGVMALGRHGWFATGWFVSILSCTLLLVLVDGIEERSVAALLVGPLVGLGVHLYGLLARSGSATPKSRNGGAHRRDMRLGRQSRPVG